MCLLYTSSPATVINRDTVVEGPIKSKSDVKINGIVRGQMCIRDRNHSYSHPSMPEISVEKQQEEITKPVSYTHLDVYKRQLYGNTMF